MEIGSIKETNLILKSLLITRPKGITIESLNKDYKNEVGHNIPYKKFGFKTIEQFLNSISDTVYLQRDGWQTLVFAVYSKKTEHIEKLIAAQKTVSKRKPKHNSYKNFSFNYTTSSRSIYPLYNNDISPFQDRYSRPTINKNQNYPNHEITNKEEQIMENSHHIENEITTDKIPIKETQNKEHTNNLKNNTENDIITIKEKQIKGINQNYKEIFSDAIPYLEFNDPVFQIDFPPDTVKCGQTILSCELPEELKEGDIFGLYVTEINNPFKFWFHLSKENNELDNMMKDLEYFYTNLQNSELIMRVSNIDPGQICAAMYGNIWHRAEILEKPEDGKVKLCFFDYGTVHKVNINFVKYLLNEFAELKKQALRGSLSNIRPLGPRWQRDATYSLLGMVADIPLYGKITKILNDEKIFQIILIDTNGKKDFQINNALILKGFAKHEKNNCNNLHSQFYYPTFEMLEKGEYPSFHEIGKMMAKGIDFETQEQNNTISDIFVEKCSVNDYIKKLTSCHVKRQDKNIIEIKETNPFYEECINAYKYYSDII